MKSDNLILITNDDGIHSEGIKALIDVATQYGEVIVVGPDRGNSAKSHSVTLTEPVYLKETESIIGVDVYACTGTPVDAVKMAFSNVLPRRPDYIFSGINHGSNATINVLYSGTMAAALEGTTYNIPSVGFSLTDFSADADFEASKQYVSRIIANVMENGLPDYTALNVNIPNIAEESINGVKVCRQTMGYWNDGFEKRVHPAGFNYYWLTGTFHNQEPENTETDEWALENNYVAVVPVKIDFTNYSAMQQLKNWNYGK